MTTVRRALLYTFAGSNTVALLQFATSLVIARLLTPTEMGVFSVAWVFVGIAQLLRDLGVSSFVIQTPALTNSILRAAFGLNLLTSWTLAGALAFAAPALANFYREPGVTEVMLVLAVNFLVSPFGAITLAIANREMRFRATAAIGVAGTLATTVTSIGLAVLGHGPVSLAWGAVAGGIITFLLSLALRRRDMPWLPSLRGVGPILRFGTALTGSSLLGFLNFNIADILLGRLISMEAVGFFNRAASLSRFIASVMQRLAGPVLLPWMSQLNRGGISVRESYGNVAERVTGLLWPVYLLVAIMSEAIIEILFGPQWNESAVLVPYICAAAIIGAPVFATSAALTATGQPSGNLLLESINFPIKLVAILLTAPHGLEAVAVTWPLLSLVGAVTHLLVIRHKLGVQPRDLFGKLYKSAILAVTTGAFVYTANHILFHYFDAPLLLVAIAPLAGITWVLVARLVGHPLVEDFRSYRSRPR